MLTGDLLAILPSVFFFDHSPPQAQLPTCFPAPSRLKSAAGKEWCSRRQSHHSPTGQRGRDRRTTRRGHKNSEVSRSWQPCCWNHSVTFLEAWTGLFKSLMLIMMLLSCEERVKSFLMYSVEVSGGLKWAWGLIMQQILSVAWSHPSALTAFLSSGWLPTACICTRVIFLKPAVIFLKIVSLSSAKVLWKYPPPSLRGRVKLVILRTRCVNTPVPEPLGWYLLKASPNFPLGEAPVTLCCNGF